MSMSASASIGSVSWKFFSRDCDRTLLFLYWLDILDDIVLPDGETRMAILGGGATYARWVCAFGTIRWDRFGGWSNFPTSCQEELAGSLTCAGCSGGKRQRARLAGL